MGSYNNFLQQCGKTELLSFHRRYEAHMEKTKKFLTPKDFYLEEIIKVAKQVQKPLKEVNK